MKILILLFLIMILLFGLSLPVLAKWNNTDTTLLIFRFIDWGQTFSIANDRIITGYNGFTGIYTYTFKYSEANPLLGPHPTIEQVNTYFIACIGADILIAKYASPKLHKWWNIIELTGETYCITHNWQIGIQLEL